MTTDYEILVDDSRAMEERIEAAERIAERYSVGEVTDKEYSLLSPVMSMSIDELDRYIRNEAWVSTLEEAIFKGVYKYRIRNYEEKIKTMDLTDLAKKFVETRSPLLRKMMSEVLEERKAEVESLVISAKILEAEFLTGNIPQISSPANLRYLSKKQIESVKEPTKSYAREAFKNGLWNLDWGDPEKYGIDVERWVNYVSKPANRDFALLVYSRGIWNPLWGDISEYTGGRNIYKL